MSAHSSKKLSPIALAVRSSIIGLSLAHGISHAATVQVNTNADSEGTNGNCSLREAIVSINSATLQDACTNSGDAFGTNDTVTISPFASNIIIALGSSDINITTDMVINASNTLSISGITVNGASQSRIFSITDGANVVIDGINIINGNVDSAIIDIEDEVGGAIYIKDSTLSLSNSNLSGNSANDGGAIYANTSTVNITSSTLSGNSAKYGLGGAIYAITSTVNITDISTLSDNSANDGFGGAIYAKDSNVNITNSTLSSNTAYAGGGAIYADNGLITITNSILSDNSANYESGGAIFIDDSNLSITNSTLTDNSANDESGGAIYAEDCGSMNITNSTISKNSAADAGGALFAKRCVAQITNSNLISNSAVDGGAIFASDGNMAIRNSTLSENFTAIGGEGGAIYADGDIIIVNSTLSGNSAIGGEGGAISAHSGRTTLSNSTLSENTAADGALYVDFGSTVDIFNSIVANSIGGADCYLSGGTINADNHNIIEDGSCATMALSVDPKLIALADNGGDTKTHALLAGSQAINGGELNSCQDYDQRDQLRDDGDGKCDIGAIEYNVNDDKSGFFVIPLSNGKTVVIPN